MNARTTALIGTLLALAACDFGVPHAIQAWTPPVAQIELGLPEVLHGIRFPEIGVGSVAPVTVSIRNRGRRAGIVRCWIEGPDADRFEVRPDRVGLQAGSSDSIELRFRPTAPQEYSAELACALGATVKRAWLAGAAFRDPPAGPHLLVVPGLVDLQYNPIESDASAEQAEARVELTNIGTEKVRFGSGDELHWKREPPSLEPMSDPGITLTPVVAESDILQVGESVTYVVRAPHALAHGALLIKSNDPDHPTVRVPIRVHPWAYDCAGLVVPPVVNFAAAGSRTIELRNQVGSAPCYIEDIGISGADSGFAFTLPAVPEVPAHQTSRVLAPGETLPVEVSFQGARSDGEKRGRLLIETLNQSGRVGRSVELVGMSILSCLTADAVDFGNVRKSCGAATRTLTISNRCAWTQSLTGVEFESRSPQGAVEFAFVREPVLPLELGPGASIELAMEARVLGEVGAAPVTVSAWTLFSTQEPQPLSVALNAVAVPESVRSEIFMQIEPVPVDFLLVIDDTTSMADKQDRLGRNLNRFFAALATSCIDYHLAATTASVDAAHGGAGTSGTFANGRFLPLDGSRPRVVTAELANGIGIARQNTTVGAANPATELLLRPAHLALTSPLITAENAGFLRSDSNLQVVVISDGADHDVVPVASYEASLDAVTGRRAVVSAVTPTRATPGSGCTYSEPGAGQDARVKDLVTRTGGVQAEICDEDWGLDGAMLASWLQKCAPRTRFELAARPVVATLVVNVDGRNFAQVDPTGALRWEYDAAENAIEFQPGYVPGAASIILVRYDEACW